MSQDPTALRQVFIDAWHKHTQKTELSDLEKKLVHLLSEHPEARALILSPQGLTQQFDRHNNPFLHLSLHLSIEEQRALDRPAGYQQLYQSLLTQHGHWHEVDHQLMNALLDFWEQHGNITDTANDDAYSIYLKQRFEEHHDNASHSLLV